MCLKITWGLFRNNNKRGWSLLLEFFRFSDIRAKHEGVVFFFSFGKNFPQAFGELNAKIKIAKFVSSTFNFRRVNTFSEYIAFFVFVLIKKTFNWRHYREIRNNIPNGTVSTILCRNTSTKETLKEFNFTLNKFFIHIFAIKCPMGFAA